MRDDDDDANRDQGLEKLPSFATVRPPGGVVDKYSAPTTVAELPDSFLDELKAATRHEAGLRAKGRDLQTTQRNPSFELQLREQLTAQLVGVGVGAEPPEPLDSREPPEPLEESPSAAASVVASEPTPAPAQSASPVPVPVAEASPRLLDGSPSPALRAAVPADGVSVFSVVVLALVAVAAIVWTFMTTLR